MAAVSLAIPVADTVQTQQMCRSWKNWAYGQGPRTVNQQLQLNVYNRPFGAATLGQLTVITSSNKKRKLSKPDTSEDPSTHSESHSRTASHDFKTSSPSPPRPIPSHLLTQDRLVRRSPTPDISSTAASSPSAAYAGLTLEGEGRSEGAAGSDTTGQTDTTRLSATRGILGSISGHSRSSSPAKRTRSEMSTEINEDVETTGGSSPTVPHTTSDPADVLPANKQSKLADKRHKREVSVDMLAYETDGSVGNNGKDNQVDDGSDVPSTASYLTSQSVGSSASSTSRASNPAKPNAISPKLIHTRDVNVRQVEPNLSIELPPVDDQIAQVMKLAQGPMRDGQKGYVTSLKWLNRVTARGSQMHKTPKQTKDILEGEIGPVDNSGMNMITDPSSTGFLDEAGDAFIPLKPGLVMGEDFEIIPQDAWDLIMKWYGLANGSPIITRYCHNTSSGEMDNLQYELHPLIFTILKLPDRSNGTSMVTVKEGTMPPVKILASRHESYMKFLRRAKLAACINLKNRVRIWRILSDLGNAPQAGMLTPAQSRSASPAPNITVPVDPGKKLVIDPLKFLATEVGSQRELVEAKDETMNDNYNGHKSLDFVGLSQEGVIVLEEQIGGPAGGEWVSDAAGSQGDRNGVPVSVTKNGLTTSTNGSLKPKANTSSGRTSPAPSGGMMTRGRTQKNGRTRGTVGLGNLGNTCYMNSALQCVRSVEELTMYFLQNEYKKELNPQNPLSHNGQVAQAYAALLRELYGENSNSSFSPRNFKQIIGRYGPSFSGYGQQDSQEFLLFLLDGLQEDLNRIHKKPYIEKPDSTDEMVHNPKALREMADKCWDIYKARNDSVITDLFAGMYKSTVVCPVCEKVSIIFDPFNNLTLQLPIENLWSRQLFFFPLHSRPIRVEVDIDKNATFSAVKEYVAKKVKVDHRKMIIAEIYKHRFFKVFDDKSSISDERIAESDRIGVFELEDVPSNWPPSKKKTTKARNMLSYSNSEDEEDLPDGDSLLAEKMLVAVFNRAPKDSSSRSQQKEVFGLPSFIVLTRDEAKDYDSILRKILAKVATMTSVDILQDGSGQSESASETQDSDTVLMTTDDADSSSDSKVYASSVQGEDEIVDISMSESGEEAPAAARISYLPALENSKSTPLVLRPGEFVKPELRSMFEIKYFSGNEMIPTSWNSLQDESKNYPALSSRLSTLRATREPHSAAEKLARRLKNIGSSSSSSDEDVDDPPPTVNGTMLSNPNDDASDESDGMPPVDQLLIPQKSRGLSRFNKNKKHRNAGLITYSHKGKRRGVSRGDEDPDEVVGAKYDGVSGPLLRLGDSILLDWTNEARDALFEDSSPGSDTGMRGTNTWNNIPILPDPELDTKRQIRTSRKRNGVSLGDCLDEFGKAEILSENDAWYCPRCKEHRRASKKFELWTSPDILVIHLKRFSTQGRLRDKLDVFVDFPVEGLDLTSRVAVQEEGKSLTYDLFAVDNHYGGLGGGHYTAFAHNFYDQNWYEYNDSMASRKGNPNVVVTSAAYLLFYRRRSSSPLGGPFENIISGAKIPDPEEIFTQTPSRNESPSAPAGEGKRLDGSSRDSSSASQGVAAALQAGNGGAGPKRTTPATTRELDGSPPGYSQELYDGERTLESMELDEEPSSGGRLLISQAVGATWSGFGNVGNENDNDIMEENLFENSSTKANSSTGATDDEDAKSFSDFGPQGSWQRGTPEPLPLEDEHIPMLMEDTATPADALGQEDVVEEIRLEDDGPSFKLD